VKLLRWGLATAGVAVVAGTVVLGAAGMGGIAQAHDPPSPEQIEQRRQMLAERLGLSLEELEAKLQAAREERIAKALAEGKITPEQAERLRNAKPGELRGAAVQRARGVALNVFDAAASILGMTREELAAALRDGKTLNEVATERGVGSFEAQLAAKLAADIQAKLAEGKISQAQADRLIANLPQMVSRLADHERGQFRGRAFGGQRFGPPPGLNQN
jgi:hypothetical protein